MLCCGIMSPRYPPTTVVGSIFFGPTCPKGSFAILDQWDAQKPVDFMRSSPQFLRGVMSINNSFHCLDFPISFFTSVGCKTFGISLFLWMALWPWLRFTDFPPQKNISLKMADVFLFLEEYPTEVPNTHFPTSPHKIPYAKPINNHISILVAVKSSSHLLKLLVF